MYTTVIAMTVPAVKVVAGAGGFTVIVTVSPGVAPLGPLMWLAGSVMFRLVMRVAPLDQNASNGSGVATTAVPLAAVSSNRMIVEPGPIVLSVLAFQSAIVSPLAPS